MTMAAGPSSQEPEGLLIVKLEEDCAWSHEVPPPEPEPSPEASHLRFRRFRFQDAPGPREALSRLQELCRGWLRPEMRTKEQILELLVLEQFLTILPQEIQSRVQELRPESGEEAVTLVERMQKELGKLRQQVTAVLPVVWPGSHCASLFCSRIYLIVLSTLYRKERDFFVAYPFLPDCSHMTTVGSEEHFHQYLVM
jgi:hypothetical protein|uniref:Zinc finger protein 263 n=1 Tax=Mus musculus TaxID=10090 RepID=E0CZ03_MOUSE